jgi:ATP-binding cassette subfamily B protein
MSNKKKRHTGRFGVIKKYLRRNKRLMLLGALAIIGANSLMMVNPYLLKVAFDKLEQQAPMNDILNIALAIVVLAIISGVFRFSMRRTIIWMSRRIEYNLRGELFGHLLTLTPSFYHNTRTGDIMARMTNDIEAVRMMIGPGIMHLANALVSSVIAISFMVYLSPKLTLYALLPLPIISIAVNRFGTIVHLRFAKVQEYFSVLTSRVQENLAGVRVIRAYNQERPEIDDFARHNEHYIKLNMHMIKIQALLFPILFLLAGLINTCVLYFGGRAVIQETISLGTLVAFFTYLMMLIWPMIAMGWVVALYQRGTASLDRINNYLKTEPDVKPTRPDRRDFSLKGKIEFRHLDFAYNEHPILKDINLVIEPGMTVGIVGPTASGKTTLVSLICRLYPVTRGQLFIDDVDINDLDMHRLRRGIGFVPQEPFLFSDTLAGNILFAVDRRDESLAREAARKAIIDREIEEFPGRYNTVVGERGITLSGGQKQRVSIARAIAAEPRILILDDVTSAVDTETEHMISQSLRGEISKRTSIIISHRVSAVKDADLIVYLDNGRVTETGRHEELLAARGAYAGLYQTQLLEEELERM